MSRRVLVSPMPLALPRTVNVERDDKDDSPGIGKSPATTAWPRQSNAFTGTSRCSRDVGLWPMLSKKSAASETASSGA